MGDGLESPCHLLLARFSTEPATLFRLGFLRWCRRLSGLFFCLGQALFVARRLLFHRLCALCFWLLWFGFGLFPFRFFSSSMLSLDDLWPLAPLNERLRRGVPLALANFCDAGLSAITLRRPWRDVVKQFLDRSLLT